MKKTTKRLFYHIINIITVALTIEFFLCSLLAVRVQARENCFERIKEITEEVLNHISDEFDGNRRELEHFAELLSESIDTQDGLIETYVENFFKTRENFCAVEILRPDGKSYTYGDLPHAYRARDSFAEELKQIPEKASEAYLTGNSSDLGYFYQAVPIKSGENTLGILYGYMTLGVFSDYVDITSYSEQCKFYIIDAKDGRFLFDELHSELGNLKNFEDMDTKYEYTTSGMKDGILSGKSDHFVFRSNDTREWLYSYYMPTGINEWMLQMTIDENTAFKSFDAVETVVLILAICVIVLMFAHVFVLMIQNLHASRADKSRLKKTKYINDIQRCLLNAHNNANFIEQALKIIADEIKAETVLLLNFDDRKVRNVYYWPSKDKSTVMNLVGRNIRDDFPIIFDTLYDDNNFVYYPGESDIEISEGAEKIFEALEVSNIMIVPIMDNAGVLKGCICAANLAQKHDSCEALECVTYDFFMAITNVENLEIIRNMGTMDYLTAVKNRNSYESELSSYATADADSLSCVFIDVNGLHEINNTLGHKAGDRLLTSVASSVKNVFDDCMVYRLGGDEFVAFGYNLSDEEIIKKKMQISAELAVNHYYISCGFYTIEKNEYGIFDVDMLIVESEKMMYKEKKKFYRGKNIPHSRASLFADEFSAK